MKPPFKMIIENEIEQYRYDTWESKEPETVEWVRSFKDGEAFFDIGANVGVFSLLCASLHPNSQIYAFEPMPKNFIRLLQNVELNGFKNVHCFNVAMDIESHLGTIFIPNNEVGQSGAQIEAPINENGKYFDSQVEQIVYHFSFDDFVNPLNVLDCHIKIDVDGHELNIVYGLDGQLLFNRPKSLLVECNEKGGDLVIGELWNRGYTIDNKFNDHPNHSRIRRKKEGIKAENVIFVRG